MKNIPKKTIYANYHLSFPHIKITSFEDFTTAKSGFAALDELWMMADSRLSASKKNRFVTYVLAKSRKRDLHIGYTTQGDERLSQVDRRIRSVTDLIAVPSLNASETICRLDIFTYPYGQRISRYKFRTDKVFQMYNTHEEIKEMTADVFGDKGEKVFNI